jgi:hypothetical protein
VPPHRYSLSSSRRSKPQRFVARLSGFAMPVLKGRISRLAWSAPTGGDRSRSGPSSSFGARRMRSGAATLSQLFPSVTALAFVAPAFPSGQLSCSSTASHPFTAAATSCGCAHAAPKCISFQIFDLRFRSVSLPHVACEWGAPPLLPLARFCSARLSSGPLFCSSTVSHPFTAAPCPSAVRSASPITCPFFPKLCLAPRALLPYANCGKMFEALKTRFRSPCEQFCVHVSLTTPTGCNLSRFPLCLGDSVAGSSRPLPEALPSLIIPRAATRSSSPALHPHHLLTVDCPQSTDFLTATVAPSSLRLSARRKRSKHFTDRNKIALLHIHAFRFFVATLALRSRVAQCAVSPALRFAVRLRRPTPKLRTSALPSCNLKLWIYYATRISRLPMTQTI